MFVTKWMQILGLIVVLASAMGCGYRFHSVKDSLPGKIKSVAIPTFTNDTHEAGIENVFTSSLRKEFFKSRVIEVVSQQKAQGIIKGRIKHINVESTAHSEEEIKSRGSKLLAREYSINVEADIYLVRASDNEVIWKRSVHDSRRYASDKDLLQNETRQRQAYAKVATYLMEQVHDMMFENF